MKIASARINNNDDDGGTEFQRGKNSKAVKCSFFLPKFRLI